MATLEQVMTDMSGVGSQEKMKLASFLEQNKLRSKKAMDEVLYGDDGFVERAKALDDSLDEHGREMLGRITDLFKESVGASAKESRDVLTKMRVLQQTLAKSTDEQSEKLSELIESGGLQSLEQQGSLGNVFKDVIRGRVKGFGDRMLRKVPGGGILADVLSERKRRKGLVAEEKERMSNIGSGGNNQTEEGEKSELAVQTESLGQTLAGGLLGGLGSKSKSNETKALEDIHKTTRDIFELLKNRLPKPDKLADRESELEDEGGGGLRGKLGAMFGKGKGGKGGGSLLGGIGNILSGVFGGIGSFITTKLVRPLMGVFKSVASGAVNTTTKVTKAAIDAAKKAATKLGAVSKSAGKAARAGASKAGQAVSKVASKAGTAAAAAGGGGGVAAGASRGLGKAARALGPAGAVVAAGVGAYSEGSAAYDRAKERGASDFEASADAALGGALGAVDAFNPIKLVTMFASEDSALGQLDEYMSVENQMEGVKALGDKGTWQYLGSLIGVSEVTSDAAERAKQMQAATMERNKLFNELIEKADGYRPAAEIQYYAAMLATAQKAKKDGAKKLLVQYFKGPGFEVDIDDAIKRYEDAGKGAAAVIQFDMDEGAGPLANTDTASLPMSGVNEDGSITAVKQSPTGTEPQRYEGDPGMQLTAKSLPYFEDTDSAEKDAIASLMRQLEFEGIDTSTLDPEKDFDVNVETLKSGDFKDYTVATATISKETALRNAMVDRTGAMSEQAQLQANSIQANALFKGTEPYGQAASGTNVIAPINNTINTKTDNIFTGTPNTRNPEPSFREVERLLYFQ